MLTGPSFAQSKKQVASDGGATRLRLSMAITKLMVTNSQLKTGPYEHHNNARSKSVNIDWPILAFWLTYFGIMFGILCGVILR